MICHYNRSFYYYCFLPLAGRCPPGQDQPCHAPAFEKKKETRKDPVSWYGTLNFLPLLSFPQKANTPVLGLIHSERLGVCKGYGGKGGWGCLDVVGAGREVRGYGPGGSSGLSHSREGVESEGHRAHFFIGLAVNQLALVVPSIESRPSDEWDTKDKYR